ncbi:hypothetical protein E2562_035604 [Oryza meyeriana var. granulata]|uniref:Uncharacterized protein n=1 Tax=Oryza meyeriana var. granulata TaxID=110450 RepID=A0A6G1ESW6_9ORYZ|nr:hypothetical protein E2562_035604 [Oryza meyeriana var. granulata]
MAAAPAVGGNGNEADEKARDATDQSKSLGRNNCEDVVLPSALRVTVSGGPVETFGSLGNLADDNVQPDEDDDHGNSTEYSSSFGPSCSASDDEMKSDMDGMEVDSPFLGPTHINVDRANSAPSMVRHKQVTAGWKKMVGPIMWRCQWLELHMKNLLSQVAKYDKELALINHEKDLQLETVKADDPKSEQAKLDTQSHERIIMKRRKRKRDEEAVDTSLYLKKHPALSYYENKKSGVETDDSLVEEIESSDDALLENDRVFEQYSLREILLTVDDVQSRILSLQGCLSNARSKYEKLSQCLDHRQVKVTQKSQKVQNHMTSCKKDGRRFLQKTKYLHSLLQKDDLDRPLAVVLPVLDRSTDCVLGYMKKNDAQEDAIQSDTNGITFETIFGKDNLLTNAHVGEFCKEPKKKVISNLRRSSQRSIQSWLCLLPKHKTLVQT